MQLNIKFTDTERDDALKAYTDEKVLSFKKLLSDNDFDGAVCHVEFRRSTRHLTGDVCYAEVTLDAGGRQYRASKEESTLMKAIDKVKDDILAALRKDKTKAHESVIKGAVHAKQMMHEEVE